MRSVLTLAALAATASAAAVSIPSPAAVQVDISTWATCSGPVKSSPTRFWLDEQDHSGNARGIAPFSDGYDTYPVYRNVLDYSVRNDGTGDQSGNLQQAIDTDGRGGSREGKGVTYQPALVYLPPGTYQLKKTLNLRVGTVIVGDPIDRPVIKASEDFSGDVLVNGYDKAAGPPETSFMTLMKNVILDTTALSPDRNITVLAWGVAQGCGLTNVEINMPPDSTGHTGINLQGGSTLAIADVVSSIPNPRTREAADTSLANHWRGCWHPELKPAGQLQECIFQTLQDSVRRNRRTHRSLARRHFRHVQTWRGHVEQRAGYDSDPRFDIDELWTRCKIP